MTYNCEVINLCIYHYNNHTKIQKISKITNISSVTIHRWIYKYNYNFINNIPLNEEEILKIKKSIIHKSSKIHLYEKIICEYVSDNNGCSINEIMENLNINLSKSSVCNILKKNNISHKRINNRIVGKNLDKIETERELFSSKITDEQFFNVICIDETSKCINDYKRYGYSEKGKEITKIYKHKHNQERRTLLSAISNKEFINNKIINGSVNGETYLNFFKKNINIFRNRCILHDNARIHHYTKLKEYCLDNNINLIYTPAYSPEFNPIELVFSEIKTIFRKLEHENLDIDILTSIACVNTNNFKNYYNHSLKFINKYRN